MEWNNGFTTFTCKRANCGNSYKANYTPAIGHNWDFLSETKGPDCQTEGDETQKCTNCKTTRVLEGEGVVGDHDYHEQSVTSATYCDELSYTTYLCQTCFEDSYIEYGNAGLGHRQYEKIKN